MITKQYNRKEQRRHNTGLAKVAVQYFYDSLAQDSSSVFQLNFCAKNRHLRQARKR